MPSITFCFNAKEDVVDLRDCRETSCLSGIISERGEITSSWSKLPLHAPTVHSRLAAVYHELPTRSAKAVKQKASTVAIAGLRGAALIVFLIVVVPLAIEVAPLGLEWFGYVVSGISILVALYKAMKTFDMLPRSDRERAADETSPRMEHYYLHCERNPGGFDCLKMENFESDAIERTRAEARAIEDQRSRQP